MTIAANDRLKAHTGDGTTTDFSFDFPILSSSEIRVTLDVSGVQTVQTIATHYTVTIAGDGTGTVSFVTAPASGTGIYFEGVTEVTQTAAYANADRFPASAHEGSMDKFAKILQEQGAKLSRALVAPVGGVMDSTALATLLAMEDDIAAAAELATSGGLDILQAVADAEAAAEEAEGFADEAELHKFAAREAETATEAYRDEASNLVSGANAGRGSFKSTAAALGNGVVGASAITGGSGGTDGEYIVAPSGGTAVYAGSLVAVVSGGALTEIRERADAKPGYYTSNPTGFDLSGVTGLTGASATPLMAPNVAVGETFSVPSDGQVDYYEVTSGPTATLLHTIYTNADMELLTGNKIPAEREVATTINNGAQYWNGVTTSGATSSSGGFFVPAGSTGQNTALICRWQITAEQAAIMAGRKARFTAHIVTSDNLVGELTVSGTPRVTVTSGLIFARNAAGSSVSPSVSPTLVGNGYRQYRTNVFLLEFEYTFRAAGDEREIEQRFSIGSNDACAADAHAFAEKFEWMALDEKGQSDALAYYVDPLTSSVGSIKHFARPEYLLSNGSEDVRNKTGILFPTGSTGLNSQFRIEAPLFDLPVGTSVRVTYTLKTSTNFTSETGTPTRAAFLRNDDGTLRSSSITSSVTVTDSTTLTGVAEFTTDADHRGMQFYFIFGTATTRTTDGWAYIEDVVLEILGAPVGVSKAKIIDDYRRRITIQSLVNEMFGDVKIVAKQAGTLVDNTSIRQAVNDLGRGDSNNFKNAALINPGWYVGEITTGATSTTTDIDPQGYIVIEGRGGQPGRTVIDVRFPASQSDQANLEGMFIKAEGIIIRNLTIIGENIRYPLHLEGGNTSARGRWILEHVDLVHLGADGWGSDTALGMGQHDDNRVVMKYCRFISYTGAAIGFHDNANWVYGASVRAEHCIFTTMDGSQAAISINNQGAGRTLDVELIGCAFDVLNITCAPWLTSRLGNQPANRFNYHVYTSGCRPFEWRATGGDVDALVLHSAAGAGSEVTFTESDGTRLVFGIGYDVRLGGVGLKANIISEHAITVAGAESDPGVTLAARLGDMTSATEDVVMQFDGGSDVTITLDQDYSGMTNDQVVTALNAKLETALGGSLGGKGFEIDTPYLNRAPVYQGGYHDQTVNADTTAILKGMALARSTRGAVRLTTSHDPWQFMGIALNDAAPGDPVDFQDGGKINEQHITVTGTPLIGNELQASSTPGILEVGSSKPVARCISVNGYAGSSTFALYRTVQ